MVQQKRKCTAANLNCTKYLQNFYTKVGVVVMGVTAHPVLVTAVCTSHYCASGTHQHTH